MEEDLDTFPRVRTGEGRTLVNAGGIFPDIEIENDTLKTVERELIATVNENQVPLGLRLAEFGFDAAEQDRWVAAALAKFADPAIPDSITRNGRDPERKLGRDDRLIGPALLALRHGHEPAALIRAVLAALDFADPDTPSPRSRHGSVSACLEAVCGLQPDEPLYARILAAAS